MFSLCEHCSAIEAFSAPHTTSEEEAGSAQASGRKHSQNSWPQWAQGISQIIWCHAQQIKLGEEERRDIWNYGTCLPKPPLHVMGPCCSDNAEHHMLMGTEWIPCPAFLKCRSSTLDIKTAFISKHEFFHIFFWFLPHPTAGEQISKQFCGACLQLG